MTFAEILVIFNNKICRCCTPVCFTFSSGLCDSAPDGTQILAYAVGIFNDKPYYQFDVCGTTQVFWYNSLDSLWYNSDVVGVPNVSPITLDNNSQYFPVSNTTNYLWNNVDSNDSIYILQSTVSECPEYRICFHLRITVDGIVYNFYNYIAPIGTPFDTGNHPQYRYTVTILGNPYLVSLFYDPVGLYWRARVNGVIIGTLLSTTFYPFGDWEPNPANPGSYFVSALFGEPCTQPPDVDCVIECGEWSECISGTRSRTCVVVTPPVGNGAPCGPLVQTEECADPFCFPPFNIIVTETNVGIEPATVTVAFTGVSGAATYTIVYTVNGGLPFTITQSGSPFVLPFVCNEADYVGTIVTNCTNGLTSSEVPFTFTTRIAEIINRGEFGTGMYQQFATSISPNGSIVFTSEHNGDNLAAYTLTTPWDVSSLIAPTTSRSINFSQPFGSNVLKGHRFSPNGSLLFACANGGANIVIRCALSTAFDITTITTAASGVYATTTIPEYIDFNPNGLEMFIVNNVGVLAKYSLSTPWQISSGVTQVSGQTLLFPSGTAGFIFQNNGTYLFSVGSQSGIGVCLFKRTLTVPYDLTSVSTPEFVPIDPALLSYTGNFYSISFRDGYKGFISAYRPGTPNTIWAFEMTCAWDISSGIIITP
jgi:hypothetical protein